MSPRGASRRVRHGIIFEPGIGFRAVREIDGEREFLGPWTTEAKAQENADTAARIFRDVLSRYAATTVDGDTPLGVWTTAADS